jgi:hypothetical protein
MNNFEHSLFIIQEAIQNNLWEKRIHIILQEKQRILDYYAFCPTIERVLNPVKEEYDLPVELVYNKFLLDVLYYTNEKKNVCFIHNVNGSNYILDNIITIIKDSGLLYTLDLLVIHNVGTTINAEKYQNPRIKVINYSLNASLNTMNLIHYYSTKMENTNILYLHTGLNIMLDNVKFILYNVVSNYKLCIESLEKYDSFGINLQKTDDGAYWDENIWWATTSYISLLDEPTEETKYWLLSYPVVNLCV